MVLGGVICPTTRPSGLLPFEIVAVLLPLDGNYGQHAVCNSGLLPASRPTSVAFLAHACLGCGLFAIGAIYSARSLVASGPCSAEHWMLRELAVSL